MKNLERNEKTGKATTFKYPELKIYDRPRHLINYLSNSALLAKRNSTTASSANFAAKLLL